MQYNIQARTFEFSLQILDLVGKVRETMAGRVIANQPLRSATSIGANIEEADSAFTKNSFAYKMNIALSEAREAHYWLRLLM